MSAQTPAALRRKIEQLEKQVEALKAFIDRDNRGQYETIAELVVLRVRAEQAVRILTGEDE